MSLNDGIEKEFVYLFKFYCTTNLLDYQDSSNLPHTGGSKKMRGENQSRDLIGSFVEVPR
jgi:hypothetical protein